MLYYYKLTPKVILIRSHIKKNYYFIGPLGSSLILNLQKFAFKININEVTKNYYLKCKLQNKQLFSLKGVLDNQIKGLLHGFKIELDIIGIGYRCLLKSNCLYLRIGYSYDVKINIPNNISVFLENEKTIILYSIDYMQLTNFCAILMKQKKVNIFTGQGIQKKFCHKKIKNVK